MNAPDYALLAAIGALLAVLILYAVRPPARAKRSYDGATVRPLRQYQTPGALTVMEAEPEPESVALAPYEPAPVIRIETGRGRLPVADSGPGWELERRIPHRTPSLEADFFVPALQAGMTAFAAGMGAGLMAWALAWSWRVPVFVMGAVFVGGWLWRLRIVDGLLWTVESIIRRDVTGDGQVGAPTPQHAFTLANPAQARSAATQEARQTADSERRAELIAFLDRCLLVGCSESKHGIKASGPERDRFLQNRETLMQLGIAAWKNPEKPKAGWGVVVSHERARQLITKHVL